MSKMIDLIVYGDPKGQPRPKAFSRGGIAKVYDPGTAEGWKGQIALAVKEEGVNGIMLENPVILTITAFFARPKGHFHTGKKAGVVKPTAPTYHTSKPDFDNVAKAACDALTQLGIWRDDSLVVQATVTKLYSDKAAWTKITIREALA